LNLARHFVPGGPNELWVGDITFSRTRLDHVASLRCISLIIKGIHLSGGQLIQASPVDVLEHFAHARLAFATSLRVPFGRDCAPASFRFGLFGLDSAVANDAPARARDDAEAQTVKKIIRLRTSAEPVRTQKLARGHPMGQRDRVLRRQMATLGHQAIAPAFPARRYAVAVYEPDGPGNVRTGNERRNHDCPGCRCSII